MNAEPLPRGSMLHALMNHWPEYLIEGALLGAFMVSACFFVILLEHPDWAGRRAIANGLVRRGLIGVAMGATAIVLIYSPWGQRSGAHMNPAVTLAFLGLGKIAPWDAAFYIAGQFAGGATGVSLIRAIFGPAVAHPAVNFVATKPGQRGAGSAWLAEFGIAFLLMSVVLTLSNLGSGAAYTGLAAGAMVALYITFEAPLSGMSMNPARTFGSAVHAREFRHLWVYFTAPPIAMLAAAGLYAAARGMDHVYCAKLEHGAGGRCIFRCHIDQLPGRERKPTEHTGIEGVGPTPPGHAGAAE